MSVYDYNYFANKKLNIVNKIFDEFDSSCDYDEVVVSVQQAIELKLKHFMIEECGLEMKTHKLTVICHKLKDKYPELMLILGDLSIIQDYYFDKRYPGEDYIETTLEECKHSIEIMKKVFSLGKELDRLNSFRR
ncbi:MAG: HEPN domain-containing protein [Anaeroplasmataceae bacterium]